MRTLKRIGLFILLKIGEILGVVLVITFGIGIWRFLDWLLVINEALPFILIGIFITILIGIPVSKANWNYVKRKIK